MKTNGANKIMNGRSAKMGFTLIEMLVVIFIITLITSGLYISSSRFSDNIVLTNLAYDVSSTIRQAQSFGLANKDWKQMYMANTTSPLAGFDAGYGIRFASDANNQFALFYDTVDSSGKNNWICGTESQPATGVSGCNSSSEGGSLYTITGRDSISKICAVYGSDPNDRDCYNFSTNSGQITYLDIIFKRVDPALSSAAGPEPNGYFSTNIGIYPNNRYQKAEITLTTPGGFIKTIVVTAIGQIYVQ